jgi:hypothetical protein
MALGLSRECRRFAAEMALLGMLFYATLLSWHYAHRALKAAGVDISQVVNSVYCHGGSVSSSDETPSKPLPTHTDCPLCAGHVTAYALFPIVNVIAHLKPSGIYGRVTRSTSAISALIDGPRSRGPPQSLVI